MTHFENMTIYACMYLIIKDQNEGLYSLLGTKRYPPYSMINIPTYETTALRLSPKFKLATYISFFTSLSITTNRYYRLEKRTNINMDIETTILNPEVSQNFWLSLLEVSTCLVANWSLSSFIALSRRSPILWSLRV